MPEAAIRQEIYTILSGVTNIGKVYDYERWAGDWSAFIALFKTTITTVGPGEEPLEDSTGAELYDSLGERLYSTEAQKISAVDQIRGWEIGRRSAPEKMATVGTSGGKYERTHGYVIRGYMSVKDADATEKEFNALVEAVATAFRDNRTLNGAAHRHDLIQAKIIDFRMFGGVLCHFAELELNVTERI